MLSLLKRLLRYFKKSSHANHELTVARQLAGVSRGLEKVGKTRFATICRAGASVLRCIEPLKEIVRGDRLNSDKKVLFFHY